MPHVWWRGAIERRLQMLAVIGFILCVGITAVAASLAARKIENALVAERQVRAREIAAPLEQALEDELRQLESIAGAAETTEGLDRVAELARGLRLSQSVLRVSADGRVMWARDVASGADTNPIIGELPRNGGSRWRAQPTDLVPTSAGPRVFLVMPARESDPAGGAFAAEINPAAGELSALLLRYEEEPYRVALRDSMRREIAASTPPPPLNGDDLSASSQVQRTGWRLDLDQPRDAALGPVFALRRVLTWVAIVACGLAILFAWGAARSIRQPVVRLTRDAERLASGDWRDPIPPAGVDEIGRLAQALEHMRGALARAFHDVSTVNAELERRVADRTRELSELYAALRLKDERRGQLLKRVIAAQEEERRRIARELHDETSQQLTALAMQIDMTAAANPTVAPKLAAPRALVSRMIDDLHRVIYDLRPSMLDDLGLLPAIRWYADRHLAAKGIKVQCEFPDTVPPLAPEARTALYRVVQEALTNIERHAMAETVLIACTVTDRDIAIEIEDDGAGFDPATMTEPRDTGQGLGLLGMRERMMLLGGQWTVDSEPGKGTRIEVKIPVMQNAPAEHGSMQNATSATTAGGGQLAAGSELKTST
jgi:signal transduction histidine kinase